jgi:gamma-glutamylcyclotransferase (GGCT)/AIG2-like uncharacterized protein YtfP
MTEPSRHLFVYGTLRQGANHPAARQLAQDGVLVGQARVVGRLYDLGPYPGMIPPTADGEWVYGELWELARPGEALPVLDRYEGCGPQDEASPLYRRRLADAHLESRAIVKCWVYWYARAVEEQQRIRSGDYKGRSLDPDAGRRCGRG